MGVIRESILAPKGYLLWACDSAQIEMRVNYWFCKQNDALEVLISGQDPYLIAAGEIYNEIINDKKDPRRKLGKARELGLQYRMGAKRFRYWCASGPLGMDPIQISLQESYKVVQSYRASKYAIVAMWEWLDGIIPRMAEKGFTLTYGPVTFNHEAILLPSGMNLIFPGLHYNQDYQSWGWGVEKFHKLHGGKLLENIIQALANCIIDDQIIDIDPLYRTVSMTHDEILGICKEEDLESCKQVVTSIMSQSPKWAPDLPLGCEFAAERFYCK